MKKALLTLAFMAPVAAMAADAPLWLRDVQIAPDGRNIAFCYRGDIFIVPTAGGQARQLTATPDYECEPRWSPDSRTIAYASDRNGNFDVYAISVDGGTPRRLTFNSASETPEAFAPDGSAVLYSAGIQAPATSAAFPSGRLTQLYSVPLTGGAPTQLVGTPVQSLSFMPDGKSFLYQDVKGFESQWRKHHTSSVTRDIWLYNTVTGRHTNLTDRGGEDTNPVADGDASFLFLSERDGKPVNVYRATVADPQHAVALTDFATHPVRFLSRSADARLAFTYDGEIYTMTEGAAPQKLAVTLPADFTPETAKLSVRSGAREAVASPDGKSVVFIWRGNVFVTSVEYPATKQISDTPQAEGDVSWDPSSQALYYSSERDGRSNIYKATMPRGEQGELDFAHATLIDEQPVFPADEHERTKPQMSPDGGKLAFILDRNILAVKDVLTGKVTELTDGKTWLHRNGRFNYSWSPDSKWIALDVVDRKHDPFTDIAIINVETGRMTNLTNTGYFDESPMWVLGGDAVMFASERYGMRNHASWGSQMDVILVFLNPEAYDRWNMSKEDLALYEEGPGKDEKDKKKDYKGPATVDLGGIERRTVRLTPMSTSLTGAMLTADGETLYYTTETADGNQLWKYSPREEEHKLVTDVPAGMSFDISADGKTMFLLGSSMKKLDPKSGKLTGITYSATMPVDYAAEREAMYDNMAREVAERFYVKDMHGVDWPAMTAAYRRFLPHINNNYDYAEMLSELLGEINVSHTGGRYSHPSGPQADRTASAGLLYDMAYTGPGLRVAEVVAGGPLDRADVNVRPGDILTAIDGRTIDHANDPAILLTDRAGRRTLLSFRNAAGATNDVVIKPISTGTMSDLMYDRWVRARAHDVDSLSGGRLGYVHIRQMNDDAFRPVYADVLGKYNDREGIVIDIRWNGGGRMHEDIEVLFSGKKYFTQEVRGQESCDMPSRRWNKPSIMVMCEACYSNAHGTPWVYSHQGLGKTVGMPVPGTMTSVNWVGMQDPSLIYGIPVIGYRLADGSFLENQQLEPDFKVANDPAVIVTGTDQQLQRAVEELLREIDAKK